MGPCYHQALPVGLVSLVACCVGGDQKVREFGKQLGLLPTQLTVGSKSEDLWLCLSFWQLCYHQPCKRSRKSVQELQKR